MLPEIRQPLALFLGHVIAIGLVRRSYRLAPRLGSDLAFVDSGTRVTDLVMVLDRALSLVLGTVAVGRAFSDLEKLRIEKPLFRLCMGIEKSAQAAPNSPQRARLRVRNVVDQREQPPLLGMVVFYQARDIHRVLTR